MVGSSRTLAVVLRAESEGFLPWPRGVPPRILRLAADVMASAESLSVLVVDESEAFLSSARHWIESRRDVHLVGTARSGAAALDAAVELSPDLVIVEAVLPGIDGFRLTRALKSRTRAPLVVIVTFHASAAARDEAFAAGADGFLAKGDFSDELDAILEVWKTEPPGLAGRVKPPARPARRGSRTAPDP